MLLLSKGQTDESLGIFQKTALFKKSVSAEYTNNFTQFDVVLTVHRR
jgi:hypothetical protein